MSKVVCLITPNHIATNPRLVKEAAALSKAGYKVHLLFTQESRYSAALDERLLSQNPAWNYTKLDWTGQNLRSKFWRIWFGLQQKVARKTLKNNKSIKAVCMAVNRNYRWQLKIAEQIDADLFIAHNLGALPIAVLAAKKRGVASGFDAEDFHRHEASDDVNEEGVKTKAKIEDKFIPQVQHFTSASPLIADAYQRLFPTQSSTVILNVFPKPAVRKQRTDQSSQLRLFWFSQTVGANRGLQDVFRALRRLNRREIVFDIFGVVPKDVKEEFEHLLGKLAFTGKHNISFKGTIPPDELMEVSHHYDIGLALEPGFSINNRIALSNKIFTYLHGGSAIIFSDTPAQKIFYEQHPEVGFIFHSGNDGQLASYLETYLSDPKVLHHHKKSSRDLFDGLLNWEEEQKLFLQSVDKTLNKVQPVPNSN